MREMGEARMAELKDMTAPEKVRFISDKIREKLGETASLRFDGAVVAYVSLGVEPMESEVFFQQFWPNTKRILDRDIEAREAEEKGPSAFEEFKELLARGRMAEERMLEELALEAEVEVEEMRWLLETFGPLLTREGYEGISEYGYLWESYPDFVNDVLVSTEDEVFDELYRDVLTVQENAAKHGNTYSFEEALDLFWELKRAESRKDWKIWSGLLKQLYGNAAEEEPQD